VSSWTVVMNGNSNTRAHESYDSVLVGTGKQKGIESLSANREWRRRCDVERQVVPGGGTRNRKRPLADYRETNGRNVQTVRGRRPQPSSGCHVGNTGETRLFAHESNSSPAETDSTEPTSCREYLIPTYNSLLRLHSNLSFVGSF